jgi:hypothetical protein
MNKNKLQLVLPKCESLSFGSRNFQAIELRNRGISYMKYVNGRQTGLVKFCVETAFYNGLLKERYKGG